MLGEKTDLKNIELVKQLSTLRDHLDVHRIVGLNVLTIHESEFSAAFSGYLQASALDGLAMHICKIYEVSIRNDLNSIPGVIDSLLVKSPSSEERACLAEFGARHSNAAEPTEVQSYFRATFGLFSGLHGEALSRLKRHRDTIGAHSDHKASRDALPSHTEFEALYDFALDFYTVVAGAVIGVGPASVPRKSGPGLLRLLKAIGVENPKFDFPLDE